MAEAATAPPAAAAEAATAAAALAAMRVKIVTVVLAYFFVSISLVFLNKVMLTEGTSIPAPLAVTWFQCVVTSVILYVLGALGRGAAPGSFFEQFPEARYDPAVATRSTVALLGLVFVGMITFNNLALKYVEVSFYNVARSLTIVFNVVLTFALLGERTSLPVLGTLAVVVAGFFLGSAGEVRFSWTGCLFGVTSSLFVALNGIYNKKALAEKELSNNIWRLSLYNNVSASLLFVPLIFLAGEHTVILANWHVLAQPQFWAFQLAGGVFGFLIGIVTTLQIKVTGPLTHNISGTAKAGVQTLLALLIWKNPTTVMNLAGTGLVLLGSMGYTHVRQREWRQCAPPVLLTRASHAHAHTLHLVPAAGAQPGAGGCQQGQAGAQARRGGGAAPGGGGGRGGGGRGERGAGGQGRRGGGAKARQQGLRRAAKRWKKSMHV